MVEEDHVLPEALSILDECDNDILVNDLSDGKEVEEPENVESRKNPTSQQCQQIINKCTQQSLPESGTGMLAQYWEWARKAGLTFPKENEKSIFTTASGSTSRSGFQQAGQKLSVVANGPKKVGVGKEGQVGVWKFVKRCHEAKNISSSQNFLGPRCQVMCPICKDQAMPTLKNLGQHILRHANETGYIDKLRCPDCDEHVSAESLQHHIQQWHKTCNMKCMKNRHGVKNPKSSESTSPTVSASVSTSVQTQSFLSTNSTHLPSKEPSHLPEAPSARAQLPVREADMKRPPSQTIWVRNDIFRPEVFAHKS